MQRYTQSRWVDWPPCIIHNRVCRLRIGGTALQLCTALDLSAAMLEAHHHIQQFAKAP